MKKALAFILLMCHINASMFLPQIAEDDVYDSSGKQVDDINSVIEYFQVALGYDHHADDEDDDNGQNFHVTKNVEYNYHQINIAVEYTKFVTVAPRKFHDIIEPGFQAFSPDIISPPPEPFTAWLSHHDLYKLQLLKK